MFLIYLDAIVGWACTLFLLWFAFTKANGKKPIKFLSALIIGYYSLVYTGVIFNWHDLTEIPEFARPLIWLLFLIPVWESIAEMNEKQNRHS